ncbi:MAG: glycosylase [Planctomycetaceae bacterium]
MPLTIPARLLSAFVAVGSLSLPLAAAADDVFPPELTHFEAVSTDPIFAAAPGQWDSKIRERGWVMKDGEQWKLWYTGYDDAEEPLKMKLGYATSMDGIRWVRYPRNPVFDDVWIEDMMVVKHGDTYFMFAEGAGDQAQLLKSADGIQWQRIRTLDVRLTNGEPIPPGPYGTPTAWFEDENWYLFYERRDQGIWLATSRDMTVWTNVSDEPLIVPGPENHDSLMIAMNQVIRHNGRYYAVLHGTGTATKPRDWCTYLAVSDDLRHWTKHPGGPLLPIPDNRSSGQLVPDGIRFRLYTMHSRIDLYLGQPAK